MNWPHLASFHKDTNPSQPLVLQGFRPNAAKGVTPVEPVKAPEFPMPCGKRETGWHRCFRLDFKGVFEMAFRERSGVLALVWAEELGGYGSPD